MNHKTSFLSALILLICTSMFSQEKAIENYTQQIAGSDLVVEMISIPKGTFTMGSPENEENSLEDESPAHSVKIDAFWMAKHEITWKLYNLFVERSIDEVEAENKASDVNIKIDAVSGATSPYIDMSLGMGIGANLPVGNVTQLAASKFCEWLSAKTGYFYRLPTEAEWEYAARAGTTTNFYFSDDSAKLGEYAWYNENSEGSYHKIGLKKPNPWGLHDMYGNVAEWTLDQ